MRGQCHAPAALYPRERPGTHCTGGWVGPRAGLDRCRKSRPPPGFDPRTIQPVASRYTDHATQPMVCGVICIICKCVILTFQAVFNNPSVFLCSLLGLQLSLVIMQVVILVRSSEWYHVVSLALLLFANYYTLFKLSRDYLICWKVYKAEQMIQEKIGG